MLQESEYEGVGLRAGSRVAGQEGQREGSIEKVGQGDEGCVRGRKDEEQESGEELSGD